MAVNRYAAPCSVCGNRVPPNGGKLSKIGGYWAATHPACEGGRPAVMATVFASGQVAYQNVKGRCEDAPCCGCCS